MSSENTVTGRHGKFVVEATLVARTTKWGVKDTLASKSEWGDSDSAGYTNRAAGRKDSTFDAEGKFDRLAQVLNLFTTGDTAEATLWMDGEQQNPANNLYYHYPRALCMDFNLTVDMDSEEVIGWTSSWGADGKFWKPGEDGIPEQTLPTVGSAEGP
jgi:hypothetical protein